MSTGLGATSAGPGATVLGTGFRARAPSVGDTGSFFMPRSGAGGWFGLARMGGSAQLPDVGRFQAQRTSASSWPAQQPNNVCCWQPGFVGSLALAFVGTAAAETCPLGGGARYRSVTRPARSEPFTGGLWNGRWKTFGPAPSVLRWPWKPLLENAKRHASHASSSISG